MIAQQTDALAAKTDDLSLSPKSHMVKRNLARLSSDFHIDILFHILIHTHRHKQNNKRGVGETAFAEHWSSVSRTLLG